MRFFCLLLLLATLTGGFKSKTKHSSKGSVSSSEDDKRSKGSSSKFPPKSGSSSSSESDCQDIYSQISANPEKVCSKKFLAIYKSLIANTPTDANATACDIVVACLRANTTFPDQPTTQNCLSVAIKVQEEISSGNLGKPNPNPGPACGQDVTEKYCNLEAVQGVLKGCSTGNDCCSKCCDEDLCGDFNCETCPACLSNRGIFTLRGGEQKRGDELKLYDKVLVNLKGDFEPIILFRHADTVSLELKPFIRLSLDNGLTVDATPNHFTDTLILFKDVAVGNKISGATVTHVEEVLNSGNLSPKTPSGTIVVNGVVVSCYAFDERFAMFINPSTFVALSKAGVWVLSWFPSTVTVALYGLYEKGLDMH